MTESKWKLILFVAILIPFCSLALFILVISRFLPSYDCSETSEAVAFARGLSEERLEKLFTDMEAVSKDESYPIDQLIDWNLEKGQKFPEPFSDIQATQIRPRQANIMLEGCFDHHVYLLFEGYEAYKDREPRKRIKLQWGEFESSGSQILWEEHEFEPGELVNASSAAGLSEKDLND